MIKRGISALFEWVGIMVVASLIAFAFVAMFIGKAAFSFVAVIILLMIVLSDKGVRHG